MTINALHSHGTTCPVPSSVSQLVLWPQWRPPLKTVSSSNCRVSGHCGVLRVWQWKVISLGLDRKKDEGGMEQKNLALCQTALFSSPRIVRKKRRDIYLRLSNRPTVPPRRLKVKVLVSVWGSKGGVELRQLVSRGQLFLPLRPFPSSSLLRGQVPPLVQVRWSGV